MPTLYLSSVAGLTAAETHISYEALPEHKRSAVFFVIKDEDTHRAQAIARAVKDVHDIWMHALAQPSSAGPGNQIRKHGDWSEDGGLVIHEDDFYVYAYALPRDMKAWELAEATGYPDRTFANYALQYIGKGQNDRWLNHIHEANRHDKATASGPLDPLRKGKLLMIRNFLESQSTTTGKKLVRKIAVFSGAYAEEKYSAVEHLLINGWVGVYRLKNLNRGDTGINASAFACRSASLSGSHTVWQDILKDFPEQGTRACTQTRSVAMVCEELNRLFPGGSFIDLQKFRGLLVSHSGTFTENQTDVFHQYTVLKPGHEPVLHIDLKMSDASAAFRINLRPLAGQKKFFGELIARLFFKGDLVMATSLIRSPGSPYFKPCAGAGKGRLDVSFDMHALESPLYALKDCPWFDRGQTWSEASLVNILSNIVERAQR